MLASSSSVSASWGFRLSSSSPVLLPCAVGRPHCCCVTAQHFSLSSIPVASALGGPFSGVVSPFHQQGFSSCSPSVARASSSSSRRRILARSTPKGGDTSDVRVFVQTIQQSGQSGNAVVFLALQGSSSMVLPVHIGEHESRALQMEIMKSTRIRPLTHDVTKNIIGALGFAITRIVITDIVQNTYYARVYMARVDEQGKPQGEEIDVDARPSDAINFAIRAGAPMYVSEKVAKTAIEPEKVLTDYTASILNANPVAQTDIERSVRETLAHFEDPCIMLQLQMDLAVQEQRYEDANAFKARLTDLKLHSQPLRLVVAMEAALADMRFEEAARLRDEYLALAEQQQQQEAEGVSESQKKC